MKTKSSLLSAIACALILDAYAAGAAASTERVLLELECVTVIEDHSLRGWNCPTITPRREYGGVEYPPGSILLLHKGTDRVEKARLGEDMILRGHHLPKGLEIMGAERGAILNFFTMPGQKVAGIALKANTQIAVHPNGEVMAIMLQADTRIGSLTFARNTSVHFYDNGQISDATVAKSGGDYQGLPLRPGREVRFNRDGSPACVSLAKNGSYRGLKVGKKLGEWDCDVEFWEKGYVNDITLRAPAEVGGYVCNPGHVKGFASGELYFCDLARAAVVKAPNQPKGEVRCEPGAIEFAPPGVLHSCGGKVMK